jgi:hypothetical protein
MSIKLMTDCGASGLLDKPFVAGLNRYNTLEIKDLLVETFPVYANGLLFTVIRIRLQKMLSLHICKMTQCNK